MTVTVKSRNQLVVPESVRRRARIKAGDRLEFKVSGRVITIVPKLAPADDESGPEQRRVIDRELANGLADVKQGRVHGPFSTADKAIRAIRSTLKERAAQKS